MRQKLITLCLNSFELAQKKPNFSAWVREQLIVEGQRAAGNTQKPQEWEYKCPCCKKTIIAPLRTSRVCFCIKEGGVNMDFVGEVVA